MPLEQLVQNKVTARGIWKITEEESTLSFGCADEISPSVTNEKKRKEFFAVRILLGELLSAWALTYSGITKDTHGKPFLIGHSLEISLSHSFPYVAAIISKANSVGIDLEQPKPKLLGVAPRILHPDERTDAGDDIVKHCIYWCAKESLIKYHGKKDLTLSKNLLIGPFARTLRGQLTGRIVANHTEEVALQYEVYDNFVIVYTS